jgi:hypothetical protein
MHIFNSQPGCIRANFDATRFESHISHHLGKYDKIVSEQCRQPTPVEEREESDLSTIVKKPSTVSFRTEIKKEKPSKKQKQTSKKKKVLPEIRVMSKAEEEIILQLRDAERDEAELSVMILMTPNVPKDMQKSALDALAAIQSVKKSRRLGLVDVEPMEDKINWIADSMS